MDSTTLNIIGLFANIVGTVILAISLSSYIRSMRLAIDAHELYILSVNHPTKPIVVMTGTDVHMDRDKKKSNFLSWLGIVLVIGGFVSQLSSYLILS